MIDHRVTTIHGETVALSDYRGKTLLIVNVASRCGYTPQYQGLQTLYERYKDRGLVVMGFPSNDFGAQEPGSETEIASFCNTQYGVTFPMFAKVHARGEDKAPLYKALTEETDEGIAGEVRWNFTKFLVSPGGQVVQRFEPGVKPLDAALVAAVEAQLG